MGSFASRSIWSSTNEDYAASGLSICDLNQDGMPDVLFSKGDGFGPIGISGPRPWHGVQWLENTGKDSFQFHRIENLAGAYSPIEVDFDRDGHIDVIAVSAFNDWTKPNAQPMV
ncbi:VCBS repeat-containing protein [Pelagicoccus sp. SDUM812002]|uniref:FG-GAP repeat domain-containing protein n=1 Tax=Pelagicoccus sp. SDUM812002 TaxID=3041266 RepID=UPI00280DBFB9|nr:VCBS repeat-containing protein [Pelagicoccus sp. SDUM812002]MDQ8184224.1 VCBS repeat-containing protein [Pelagicoccus sp. SDUM812002]